MMSRVLLMALVTAASLACDEGNSPTTPTTLPATLVLQPGQRTPVTNTFNVTFEGVVNDSRCPLDVQCVSAGDAVMAFVFESGFTRTRQELRLNDPAQRSTTFESYAIEVRRLEPGPTSTRPVDPAAYRATIYVSSR